MVVVGQDPGNNGVHIFKNGEIWMVSWDIHGYLMRFVSTVPILGMLVPFGSLDAR